MINKRRLVEKFIQISLDQQDMTLRPGLSLVEMSDVQLIQAGYFLAGEVSPKESTLKVECLNLTYIHSRFDVVLRWLRGGKKKKKPGNNANSKEFLNSYAWRKLRMVVLRKHGATCQCCGRSRVNGVTIHVDHIKPRRKYPELALDESNLQVLCHECNHGKGNWDETDWR